MATKIDKRVRILMEKLSMSFEDAQDIARDQLADEEEIHDADEPADDDDQETETTED